MSDGDYELSLTDFETYHTICNVNSSNNKFYFDEDNKEIVIPEGSYDINKYLKRAILQFNNCKILIIAKEKMLRKEDEIYPITIHVNNYTSEIKVRKKVRLNVLIK